MIIDRLADMTQLIVISKEELQELIEMSVHKVLDERSDRSDQSERSEHSEILTVHQAMDYLKIAKQTMYRYTSKNLIPFFKKQQKLYFRKADLEQWVLDGKQQTISEMTIEYNNNRTLKIKK